MNDPDFNVVPKFKKTNEAAMTEIVGWWELRRIVYNLVVGSTGLFSVIAMVLIGSTLVRPGDDFVEPVAVMFGAVMFGILANVCYSLGWIVELGFVKGRRAHHEAYRRLFFRLGLTLSCVLATAPVWAAVLAWVIHRVKASGNV